MGVLLTADAAATGGASIISMIIVWGSLFAVLYFLMIRPSKKEQKRIGAMLSNLEVGDCVLTTSGFYGVIIDISDDTVIVEFGSNKNCRIPMQKAAITQVEKAGGNQ